MTTSILRKTVITDSEEYRFYGPPEDGRTPAGPENIHCVESGQSPLLRFYDDVRATVTAQFGSHPRIRLYGSAFVRLVASPCCKIRAIAQDRAHFRASVAPQSRLWADARAGAWLHLTLDAAAGAWVRAGGNSRIWLATASTGLVVVKGVAQSMARSRVRLTYGTTVVSGPVFVQAPPDARVILDGPEPLVLGGRQSRKAVI